MKKTKKISYVLIFINFNFIFTTEELILAIKKCAEFDNIDHIINLLKTQNLDLEYKDKHFGYTPLILAGYKNNLKIIKLLIDSGANINAYGDDGNNVLIIFFLVSNIKAFKLLIDSGANLFKRHLKNGKTVYDYAKDLNIKEYISIIESKTILINELFDAIKNGEEEKVKTIMKKNNSYGLYDPDGNNALHIAVKIKDPSSSIKMFKLILSIRTKLIYKKNDLGLTPLEENLYILALLNVIQNEY